MTDNNTFTLDEAIEQVKKLLLAVEYGGDTILAALESAKATIAKLQAPPRSDFEVWREALTVAYAHPANNIGDALHVANAALRKHRETKEPVDRLTELNCRIYPTTT